MASRVNKDLINNQKGGTALLIVMMLMSGFLLITLSASDIVRNGLIMSKTQMESTKAYFAAEAGAERILWEVRRTGGIDPGNGSSSGLCQTTPAKYCFTQELEGDIDRCVAYLNSCPANPITENQRLLNNTYYKLNFRYETDGVVSTTTLVSVGSIQGLNRTIKVSY